MGDTGRLTHAYTHRGGEGREGKRREERQGEGEGKDIGSGGMLSRPRRKTKKGEGDREGEMTRR